MTHPSCSLCTFFTPIEETSWGYCNLWLVDDSPMRLTSDSDDVELKTHEDFSCVEFLEVIEGES